MNESIERIKKIIDEYRIIYQRINEIYERSQKEETTGYVELMMLLHEVRISDIILNITANSFVKEVGLFSENSNKFSDAFYAVTTYDNVPKFFVDNKAVTNIRLSNEFTYALTTLYERYATIFQNFMNNPILIDSYNIIKRRLDKCQNIINQKLNAIDDVKGEPFDDVYMYGMANKAISRAYKNNNVNECSILPDEFRRMVIDIFHHDLNVFDTNDIGKLFYIGLEKFTKLNHYGNQLLVNEKNQNIKRREK